MGDSKLKGQDFCKALQLLPSELRLQSFLLAQDRCACAVALGTATVHQELTKGYFKRLTTQDSSGTLINLLLMATGVYLCVLQEKRALRVSMEVPESLSNFGPEPWSSARFPTTRGTTNSKEKETRGG